MDKPKIDEKLLELMTAAYQQYEKTKRITLTAEQGYECVAVLLGWSAALQLWGEGLQENLDAANNRWNERFPAPEPARDWLTALGRPYVPPV